RSTKQRMEVMLAADYNEENVDHKLTELQDMIAEILIDENESLTTEDVNKCLINQKEESIQIKTDDEIIKDVTSREEGATGERGRVQSISNNAAMNAFSTSVKWAKGNDMSASDILVLKRLQENIPKVSFQAKNKGKLKDF
ncbi:hypothetical protein J6590_017017, partial [Homalodisca vitripennis]